MNVSSNESNGIQRDFDYYDLFREWDERQRKYEFASAVIVLALVVLGIVFNIIAIVVLFRRRLWKQHEGYLYLLAIFIANIVTAIVVYLDKSLRILRVEFKFQDTSDFACKMSSLLDGVLLSAGWYTSALLLNVCLRGHLTHHTGCCTCCQRLAIRYCTVVGSLVVNGLLVFFFVVMNSWELWAAKLKIFTGIHESEEIHHAHCLIRDASETWMFVSHSIQLFAPVCFVIPVLWTVAVWTSRRHGPGFALIFSGQDDHQIDEAKVFLRLSTIVGAVVFVLHFPAIVVDLWTNTAAYGIYYQFIDVVMLFLTTHIVVIPLCFLVGGKQMRDELKLLFTSVCCRRNNLTNDRYRAILLEPVENPSTETMTPNQ